MFQGFPKDGVVFLQELSRQNTKEWFNTNKKRFKSNLETPAKEFAAEMEENLGDGWTSKVFRIYRDLRFSKDKTPYNTHMRIGFSKDGEAGFFFSLEPKELILGAGVFEFSKTGLSDYREAVAGDRGAELAKILAAHEANGYRTEEPELKRVPRGFDADHPRAELLKRKGLALFKHDKVPKSLQGSGAVEHCLKVFEELADFRGWLQGVL